jgi:hypothetical protein
MINDAPPVRINRDPRLAAVFWGNSLNMPEKVQYSSRSLGPAMTPAERLREK